MVTGVLAKIVHRHSECAPSVGVPCKRPSAFLAKAHFKEDVIFQEQTAGQLGVCLRALNLSTTCMKQILARMPGLGTSTRTCGEPGRNFCVFFFYRPIGRPRRTSMPLECHATQLGQVPFSPRGLLSWTEEQSWTRDFASPNFFFFGRRNY